MIPFLSVESLRLAGYALVAGLLVWAGVTVANWHSDSRQLQATRQQLAAERASHAREIALAAKASKDYHDELDSIRAARQPVPVVRLCVATPARTAPVTPGRTDDSATPSGMGLSGATGGDQPGPLRRYGR